MSPTKCNNFVGIFYRILHLVVICVGPENDAVASMLSKRASPVTSILLTNATAFTQLLYTSSGHFQHSRIASLEYVCKLLFWTHCWVSRLKNSVSLLHFLQYFVWWLIPLIPWYGVDSHVAHVFDISDS